MRDAPIGVMDSGVGGLTVVKEIMRQLPNEEIIFYGDSMRCPYGNRGPEEILSLTFKILDFLVEQGVKMLVIACNTATAVGLVEARLRYSVPVVGVIAPGARAAIAATINQKIGVIGTKATIRSKSYPRALRQTHTGLQILSQACPEFVSIVEKGWQDEETTAAVVSSALAVFENSGIDTMILGCTHYPLLAPIISSVLGPQVKLISSAEETARDISHWLTEEGLTRTQRDAPEHLFYTSGDVTKMNEVGKSWIGISIQTYFHDVWMEQIQEGL